MSILFHQMTSKNYILSFTNDDRYLYLTQLHTTIKACLVSSYLSTRININSRTIAITGTGKNHCGWLGDRLN
ncbi:MAG: hypothetical protein V7L04_18835 [Nostoc sp.]|uniref:hypothetical protein n=1 Tax=Nostoc sp. TaxID=1180 RepID=UPI002FF6D5B7